MTQLLLDTHALLWALGDPARLTPEAREAIVEPSNRVVVSTVSAWEMTIKSALRRLDVPDDLPQQLDDMRVDVLPVGLDHALAVGRLPPLHGDPFDRMLVAQATVEGLTLVTRDEAVRQYDVPVLMA